MPLEKSASRKLSERANKTTVQYSIFMKKLSQLLLISYCFALISCSSKKTKSDIEIEFVQDTLQVGYTYWWPESGPFIGQCGDELSLVFSGTVTDLQQPNEDAGPLYTSQKGTIAIERIYKIKDLGESSYANQKFITTDCFAGLDLDIGDSVLVCCYDFEDDYTVPGAKSIIRINTTDDPLIASIKRYIDTDQDAVAIKKDVGIWAKEGLGRKLQEVIHCAEEMNSETSSNSIDNQ